MLEKLSEEYAKVDLSATKIQIPRTQSQNKTQKLSQSTNIVTRSILLFLAELVPPV